MTMITPSYLGETIEYSSLHACRSTLEDPTVAGDEATLDFVMTKAKCEADDLPVVFVADRVVGSYIALVESDVSGELARLIRG